MPTACLGSYDPIASSWEEEKRLVAKAELEWQVDIILKNGTIYLLSTMRFDVVQKHFWYHDFLVFVS